MGQQQKKTKNLGTQVTKGLKKHQGKQLTLLSFSTLSHTGLKKDREVGHANGIIYLRQVAPAGARPVPGDTLVLLFLTSLTYCKCTDIYILDVNRGELINLEHHVGFGIL